MSISEKQKENALKEYGKLPPLFIPNCGQLNSGIQYYAHSNPRIHFAPDEIKIMFWEHRLRNDRCWRRIRDIPAKEETDRYVRGMPPRLVVDQSQTVE